jgi:hypothetical protein
MEDNQNLNDEIGENGIPLRLVGIKEGDIVVFRKASIMRNLRNVRLGWNPEMNYLCGQKRIITFDMMNKINEGAVEIWREKEYRISLDMLEFYRENKIEEKKELNHNNFSILKDKKEKNIIDEMISKVDKIRFKKLLTIGANREGMSIKDLKDEVVHRYLQEWAEAKYEYYLLFNKNFFIEKEIEIEMNKEEMKLNLINLCYKFPQYAPIITEFRVNSWLSNTCFDNSLFEKYYPEYKESMKLSKFMATLYNDKIVNDAIAGVLSNRKIIARVAISIGPYDYLTMSLNNYDWQSCQKIGDGCYSTGTLSLMIDDCTLIGYKYSGDNQRFNYNNFKFEGNSKSWRQCIYFDKKSSSMIFSRQYPCIIDDVAKVLREMLEEQVSNYLNIKNTWKVENENHDGYESGSDCLYHDCNEGCPHKMVIHKEKTKNILPSFVVGRNIYCVKCGESITESQDNFISSNCDC